MEILNKRLLLTDEEEAFALFSPWVDGLLVHNRSIVEHADDSVVREVAGRELVLRRGRGYPVQISKMNSEDPTASVVALGGHLKNTIAGVAGGYLYLSQHIGDLENEQTLRSFQKIQETWKTRYQIISDEIVCDQHPGYLSTEFAFQRTRNVFQVQHHHAHALACMARK